MESDNLDNHDNQLSKKSFCSYIKPLLSCWWQ